MTGWPCVCGHSAAVHNAWWDDDNGRSGMGCDLCECGDVERPNRSGGGDMDDSLFNFGDFPLHSGGRSAFKIDCDHLTDDDLGALGALAASLYRWSDAFGIGTGGSRFAQVLAVYNTRDETDPRMIVDDVLTTGGSMEIERERMGGESFGLVIFARSEPADWIRAIFRLSVGPWEAT